jgi:hypothetical protein
MNGMIVKKLHWRLGEWLLKPHQVGLLFHSGSVQYVSKNLSNG